MKPCGSQVLHCSTSERHASVVVRCQGAGRGGVMVAAETPGSSRSLLAMALLATALLALRRRGRSGAPAGQVTVTLGEQPRCLKWKGSGVPVCHQDRPQVVA